MDFSKLKKGNLLCVEWRDATTFDNINKFTMKHPSEYLTPTTNVGFFVTQDKECILISNMTFGQRKLKRFDNITLIPKSLITKIELKK